MPMSCLECGSPRSPDHAYCPHCGAKLEAALDEPNGRADGERKQVTVLFCDVERSTELQQDVDPEEWRRILNRLVGLLTAAIHRYEGTVDKFTGDGIMAIFGAPIALEDHARRACAAALQLQRDVDELASELGRTHAIRLALRTGLNSGDVVVGGIGHGLDMSYTAIGATVTLAKRMESLAAPGTICLSEATARLVDGFFALADLGSQRPKGFSEPVRTYRLAGSVPFKASIDVASERGLSRFVGRADELGTLERALARVLAGEGLVVALVGQAGVGKSRLCHEFTQVCRAKGITVRKTASVAHERPIAYLPVIQLLRDFFELAPDTTAAVVREVVAERLRPLDVDADDVYLLCDLLGAPDPDHALGPIDPSARERRLLDVIIRMTHARSRQEPVVLLIEDLHWLDGPSASIILGYLERLPPRTLVLVNFRPEYEAPFAEKSFCTLLGLRPLEADATDDLLDDLLGEDASLEQLRRTVASRAEGNPFFLEELVLELRDQAAIQGIRGSYRLAGSVDEIAIPPTVHATIAARIDRLAKRDKHILEIASVVGREVPLRLLAQVAKVPGLDESVDALVQAELLQPTPVSEPTCEFRHPLTRQVAYDSQLSENRTRLHASVAQAFQDLFPASLDEYAPLVAHHYEHADRRWEAARWHGRAAGWIGLRNVAEAQRHWQRVRSLLGDGEDAPEARELLARAHVGLLRSGYWQDTRQEGETTLLEEGIGLAHRLDEGGLKAALLCMSSGWMFMAGDVPRSIDLGEEALVAAEDSGDPGVVLWITSILIWFLMAGGRLDRASTIAEHANRIAASDADAGRPWSGYRPAGFLDATWGLLSVEVGRLNDAERLLQRAMRRSEAPSDSFPRMAAQAFLGLLAHARGDGDATLDHVASAVELASRTGSSGQEIFTGVGLGAARCARAEWPEAIEVVGPALELMRDRGVMLAWEALALALLAEARLGLDQVQQARSLAEDAVRAAQARGTPTGEIRGELALARVLLREDDPAARDQVRAHLDRAFHVTRETGARLYLPHIHEASGQLLDRQGDLAARVEIETAHRLLVELDASGHAARLEQEIASGGVGVRPPRQRST